MQLAFTIPGAVRGKGRPRFGNGHTYTDAKTATYERLVGVEGRKALFTAKPFAEPLSVDLTFRMTPPKSASRVKRAAMLSGENAYLGAYDIDNLCKAVLDGLNKVVWTDDKFVVELNARKIAAEEAGVDVVIRPYGAAA